MTIAIALSGGGARGDFEVGALRYLYEQGIRPEVLCGTSVGAINAAKLAEGEDPGQPEQGFAGLASIWRSLRSNDDMYRQEDWLHDPQMDSRLADYLVGKTSNPGIYAPVPGGPWGLLQKCVDAVKDGVFLLGDGASLLLSIGVILSKARGLFNLGPIQGRLQTDFDIARLQAWAAGGGKLRLAVVALDSGRLRYVTETGLLLERDGTPVADPTRVAPECAQIAADLAALETEIAQRQDAIRDLQSELRAAAPGEKAGLVAQIRAQQRELAGPLAQHREQAAQLQACAISHPVPFQLADLRDGVLASASIPGIFLPVKLGAEYYVDGGVREVNALQAAVDLGADTIYAVWASSAALPAYRTPTSAGVLDIVARSLEVIAIDEIAQSDRNLRLQPGQATPNIVHIEPAFDVHDIVTIDPGLIKITEDYGYMRAADTLDGALASRRGELATLITQARLAIWRNENVLAGEPDPTQPHVIPLPVEQAAIDQQKQQLQGLIAERRAAPNNGPLPADIDVWTRHPEWHSWRSSDDSGSQHSLLAGDTLGPEQSITSPSGRYRLVYQGDGNLVLYDGSTALWASATNGQAVGHCDMQHDGNLVIYAPDGSPLWATDTWHSPGSRLDLQDDGNLVLYAPDNAVPWSSNTWVPTGPQAQGEHMLPGTVLDPDDAIVSANGRYRFVYQSDGNLVLYDGNRALWATGTNGRPVGVCIMQGDGNLVIYGRGASVQWASNTDQHPGSELDVQDDGNVVIYAPDRSVLWASNT